MDSSDWYLNRFQDILALPVRGRQEHPQGPMTCVLFNAQSPGKDNIFCYGLGSLPFENILALPARGGSGPSPLVYDLNTS